MDKNVIAPQEPTREMVLAGVEHVLRLDDETEAEPGSDEHYRAMGCVYAIWKDMLRALPPNTCNRPLIAA